MQGRVYQLNKPKMLPVQPHLDMGYVVLPLGWKEKGCKIPGWPKARWVAGGLWTDAGEVWHGVVAPGIGYRLDDLVMLDFDFDDPAYQRIVNITGHPIRSRANSCRQALLTRCPDLAGQNFRLLSPKFYGGGRLEILGGPGRLIFAHGTHPSGEELQWEGLGPMRDLPVWAVRSLEQYMEGFVARATELFGDPVSEGYNRGVGDHEVVNDLVDDMIFESANGEAVWEVRELEEELASGEMERVHLTAFRPDSDSGAGLARLDQDGSLIVTDLVTEIVHRRADPEPVDLGEVQLTSPIDRSRGGGNALPPPRWVFVREHAKYMDCENPLKPLIPSNGFYRGVSKEERKKIERAIPSVWRTFWDPRQSEGRVGNEFNTFRRPKWEGSGEVDTLLKALKQILPQHHEMFVLHLAAKVQMPWQRLWPFALVGPPGTGKSSILRVVQTLWGSELVSVAKTMQGMYENKYHDYLWRKLYALAHEVSDADIGSSIVAARSAANVLKAIGDTESTVETLNIKYGGQMVVPVAATLGVATNHYGALPLEANDRRWGVLDTWEKTFDPTALMAWVRVEANRAEFFRVFGAMDITGLNLWKPPQTKARERMIEAGKSDLEGLMGEFFDAVRETGGYANRDILKRFLQKHDLHGGVRTVAGRMYRQALPEERHVKYGGKKQLVRHTTDADSTLSGPEIGENLEKLIGHVLD